MQKEAENTFPVETSKANVQEENKLTIDEIVEKIVFEEKSIFFKEKINKAKEDKKYYDIFIVKNKKNENYFRFNKINFHSQTQEDVFRAIQRYKLQFCN